MGHKIWMGMLKLSMITNVWGECCLKVKKKFFLHIKCIFDQQCVKLPLGTGPTVSQFSVVTTVILHMALQARRVIFNFTKFSKQFSLLPIIILGILSGQHFIEKFSEFIFNKAERGFCLLARAAKPSETREVH